MEALQIQLRDSISSHSSSGEDYHLSFQPQQPPEEVIARDLHSDDEHSGHVDREYTGVFEGPEKTLEVFFRKIGGGPPDVVSPGEKAGLRRLSRRDLDKICDRARCSILSSISNQYLDAYVLSESSLFIYPHMVMLKTCGTTTLLRCIAILIELGKRLGLEIDWVGYSRKNFNFPGDQEFPHQSFFQEMEYLNSHRNLCERLDGNGYTLGPVTSDHWFVFVADHTLRSKAAEVDTDRVLNIMMFDVDETVGNIFYYKNYQTKKGESKEEETKRISREQTAKSGIDALCPGAVIDAQAFEPCGYSMNAILFRSYSTIHITPESGSSYVSFETNQKVASYKSLINNVIRTFRPKRFVMTLLADEGGVKEMKDNPFTDSADKVVATVPPVKGMASKVQMLYKRSSVASIKVEDDCCCMMGNWALEKDPEKENLSRIRDKQRARGSSFS